MLCVFIFLFSNFSKYRAAVQECPSEESDPDDHLRAEQRQKNLEAKHANIRELIGMCAFVCLLKTNTAIYTNNSILLIRSHSKCDL